jgi:hypothetical protein
MKNYTRALLGALLLAGASAHAQEGYSAPGFPLLPHRRPQPPAGPAAPRLASPILPRFWHEADPARQAVGREQFFKFVSEQAQYPAAARPAPDHPTDLLPTGRILVCTSRRASPGASWPAPKPTTRPLPCAPSMPRPCACWARCASCARPPPRIRW